MIILSEPFRSLDLLEARLESMGWTKLQVIGDHMQKRKDPVGAEEADVILTLSEQNTTYGPKARMQSMTPSPRSHCVPIYFTPEQYRVFEEAVLSSGGSRSGRGFVDKEAAVVRIIEKAGMRDHGTLPRRD